MEATQRARSSAILVQILLSMQLVSTCALVCRFRIDPESGEIRVSVSADADHTLIDRENRDLVRDLRSLTVEAADGGGRTATVKVRGGVGRSRRGRAGAAGTNTVGAVTSRKLGAGWNDRGSQVEWMGSCGVSQVAQTAREGVRSGGEGGRQRHQVEELCVGM